MKVEKLSFKNGTDLELGPLTVLIGPNNVGKSQLLKDIKNCFLGSTFPKVLLNSVERSTITRVEDILAGIEYVTPSTQSAPATLRALGPNLVEPFELQVYLKDIETFATRNEVPDSSLFLYRIAHLNTEARLTVTKTGPSHAMLKTAPRSLLQALMIDKDGHQKTLQKLILETFGLHIVLDWTSMQEVCFRVSKYEIKPLTDPTKDVYRMSMLENLDDQGDGLRSFIGVVLSLMLCKDRIILLDEPEGFLHPAQARKLGQWIAEWSKNSSVQLVIATHNASFLSGLMSKTQTFDVFRMDRKADTLLMERISATILSKLAKNPLLSSQRVVEALFHQGVIVCEGDMDRIYYQSATELITLERDFFFTNAQGKQALHEVVATMKEAGVPVVAIVDFDILRNGDEFERLLSAFSGSKDQADLLILRNDIASTVKMQQDSEILADLTNEVKVLLEELKSGKHTLSGARTALKRIRETSNWKNLKKQGYRCLPTAHQAKFGELDYLCLRQGLFIVPVGTVESWLDVQNPTGPWIVDALNSLSNNGCPPKLQAFMQSILTTLSART